MSKKDKKSKREKNELDLILAQLKKSYNEDSSEPESDDDSYDSNDNAEFSEMLEKLFANGTTLPSQSEDEDENNDDSLTLDEPSEETTDDLEEAFDEDVDVPTLDEPFIEQDENITSEDPSDESAVLDEAPDNEENTVFEESVNEEDTIIEEAIDTETVTDGAPSLFDKSASENQSESDVDGVLQLMFANNLQRSELPDEELENTHTLVDEIPPVDEENIIDEESLIDEEIITDDDDLINNDLSEMPSIDIAESNQYFNDEEYVDLDKYDGTYEYGEDEEIALDNEQLCEEYEDVEFSVSDEEYDSEEIDLYDESIVILDPSLYTFDPLQDQLPEFSTVGIEESELPDLSSKSAVEAPATSKEGTAEEKEQFNSNDISLLLKFGYGEEVKSQIGEEEAQKVLVENDSNFRPESHKIPYGFCGKEFSDRSQANKIRDKFKSDKNLLIIQLILVSIVAVAMLALETFFEFASDRSSYLVINTFEILLISVTFLILNKKIISGILGIIRFEANLYSILAYLIFAYALCNIATTLVYVIRYPISDTSGFMVFGFCIMLYVILVLVSELLNCLREAAAFDLICKSESFYTAEKHTVKSSDNATASVGMENKSSYRLTKTSLISGYFRKASKSISGNTNLIYIIGIVPIISLIVGCASAIISENVMCGIFSMMITTLLCTPFAYILLPSVTEYLSSVSLKKKKIAFIGSDAPEKLAKADALFFDDTNAVEIISYTEIHPTKSTDGQRMLDIARRVFKSLDGPLGDFTRLHEDNQNVAGTKSEVVINSITDNGIEIYFESSINILIGDKNYMQSHNIKVKTDSNLNTAIKGFDRSVIYMAFDGIPKLGFIITSKIKPEFSSIVSMLDENGIKVFVDTYEPQINDLYFEQNKTNDSATVSVCKSEEYESTDYKPICDGNVVCSSDSFALAETIIECRKIVTRRRTNQRIHLALVLGGILLSSLFTALLNVNQAIFILSGLKSHISLVLNVIMILGLIPCIVSIIKARKQHREQKQDNTKEKK